MTIYRNPWIHNVYSQKNKISNKENQNKETVINHMIDTWIKYFQNKYLLTDHEVINEILLCASSIVVFFLQKNNKQTPIINKRIHHIPIGIIMSHPNPSIGQLIIRRNTAIRKISNDKYIKNFQKVFINEIIKK
jgi:hypothetical protein